MVNIMITGASSGIGKATAEYLAAKGFNVFLTSRNAEMLGDLSDKLQKRYPNVTIGFAAGNVAINDDVENVLEKCKSLLGKVDILFANAGVGYLYDLEKTPEMVFDEMFGTNVKGVFLWLKAILPDMKKMNKGQIVIMSSTSGLRTWAQGSIYCATKHALEGMIGALRQELEPTQIKVTTINPGAVDTPWFDKYKGFNSPDFNRGKMLKPIDIARIIHQIITQGETWNIERMVVTY